MALAPQGNSDDNNWGDARTVLAVAGYLPPHPSQRFTAACLLLVSSIFDDLEKG
jgi:hypothetical protein